MFDQLSYEDFLSLTTYGKRIAVYREFPSDLITPIAAIQSLREVGKEISLLESALKEEEVGRYSFIGFRPVAEVRCRGMRSEVMEGGQQHIEEGDPFELLRKLHAKYRCKSNKALKGFAGGMVGYLAYDAVRYIEKIPDRHEKGREVPDILFQFHQEALTFDHEKKCLTVVVVAEVDNDPKVAYDEALEAINQIYKLLSRSLSEPIKKEEKPQHALEMDLDDVAFAKLVEKAKGYIRSGDVFQIVPSRSFKRKFEAEPFSIYRALRMINPSPFMFFFDFKDFSVAGASPEKLVSVRERDLETIPLAGTRPRKKGDEDLLMEKELLSDPKEDAEHMMLVDLGRNDLGRISEPGTVHVKRMKVVQRFSHVMHLASMIGGTMEKRYDAFDALKATLPAGTLSGAPKVRAMELIDELENSRRGIYGGAICMINADGNLESCIAIRMVLLKDGMATVRCGAGVVYDSVPEKEAKETRQKAQAVLEAIELAEKGVL